METTNNYDATPESIWVMIKENAAAIKQLTRDIEMTRVEMREMAAETHREVRGLRKIVDNLNKAFGRSIERLTTPNLQGKFKTLGYEFDIQNRNVIFRDDQNHYLAEVDVLLENHKYAMAVEVKNNLQNDDIVDHLARLRTLRKYADSNGDSRKYLGALAAPDIDSQTTAAICKAGFFVVRMSHNAVDVITTEGFKPKEW